MKIVKLFLIITASLIFILSVSAEAQHLDGKNRVEMRFGITANGFDSGIEIGSQGVGVKTGNSGLVTTLSYSRYIQENLAVTFAVSPILADNGLTADISGVNVGTNTVTPIYLGLRYYPFRSTYGKSLRPYLSFGAGPVIGSESGVDIDDVIYVGTHTETTFGARAGFGIDLLLSNKFILGFDSGYNLMSDFSEAIGGEENYSGGDFSIGLSFLWGGK